MATISFNRSNGQWQDETGVAVTLNTDTFVDGSPYVAVGTVGSFPNNDWVVVDISDVDSVQICQLLLPGMPIGSESIELPFVAVQALRTVEGF